MDRNTNRYSLSGIKPPSPHVGSPLGWSRAVGLAARHRCHDRHHPVPACSVVVMAMTVYLQGGTLVSNVSGKHTRTHKPSEEVEVRERERDEGSCQTDNLLKGQVDDRSHVISAGPFFRTVTTQQNRRYQSLSAADFCYV